MKTLTIAAGYAGSRVLFPHDRAWAAPSQFSEAAEDQGAIASRKHSSRSHHAAIIGAGVAGLEAARVLAHAGWDVDVFEQSPEVGGFCSTLQIDGFTFDLGPHVFHPSIRELVPFRDNDLDGARFSESFLMNDRFLNFPGDLVTHGYLLDMLAALFKNTADPSRLQSDDMERLAAAGYGDKASREIFKPLIEKWCKAPLSSLDRRYFASRMHSRLDMDNVMGHVRRMLSELEKKASFGTGGNKGGESQLASSGIPDAPGYAGRIGAKIIPFRLAQAAGSVRIHCNHAVTALEVDGSRITRLDAGNRQFRPDFVISTTPLNRLAGMTTGTEALKSLADIRYLNVIFILARIARAGLTQSEWSWIPQPDVPFYRISEMKVLNKAHAPEHATGLCLEVTCRLDDPLLREPESYWKDRASKFLEKTFSLSQRDVLGVDVVRRDYAYPDFTQRNTEILGKLLSTPFRTGHQGHEFRTGIENLACAGRAGTFIYLLTPGSIRSGRAAARKAVLYADAKA